MVPALRQEGNVYRWALSQRPTPGWRREHFRAGSINIAKHCPPGGGRDPFQSWVYKHHPPGGGRVLVTTTIYKHYPPNGGRDPFQSWVYKHYPPGGGRNHFR